MTTRRRGTLRVLSGALALAALSATAVAAQTGSARTATPANAEWQAQLSPGRVSLEIQPRWERSPLME